MRTPSVACWNPSTSDTNRGLEEWPVGIPLPYIPIEDSKRSLLESLYLRYYRDAANRRLCRT